MDLPLEDAVKLWALHNDPSLLMDDRFDALLLFIHELLRLSLRKQQPVGLRIFNPSNS